MTGVLYLLVDVARPLRKLEDAVSRVGEDINRDPVPEEGSAEVRGSPALQRNGAPPG